MQTLLALHAEQTQRLAEAELKLKRQRISQNCDGGHPTACQAEVAAGRSSTLRRGIGDRRSRLRRVGFVVAEQQVLRILMVHGKLPSSSCSTLIALLPTAASDGFLASANQFHVLRNQSCGSTCRRVACGPRLVAVMRRRTSSTSALAYSMSTSKYLSASNRPVSISSNSGCCFPRRRFSSTSNSYGRPPADTCTACKHRNRSNQ